MPRPASIVAELGRRSRRPSARTIVAGSLLAAGIVFPALSTNTGCSTQETTPAPDAGLPPCNTGPFIFCKPVGPDTPSCSTDDRVSPWLTRLPRATRYPVGCVIDYVGDRDEQGDCKLEAVCKCIEGELPARTSDAGSTEADAGTDPGDAGDAGDGSDASTPSPSSDAGGPSRGPIWNCYP